MAQVHIDIAAAIADQVADEIATLNNIQAQVNSAATRTTGRESFMARHKVAAHYFSETKRHADLLKDNGLKASENAEAICAELGIAYKTVSNFRAVSELHTDQAEKSYSALGFQGSIDATKKFAHLKPETVNAICTRTAEALGIKPVQSAGRHLIKHADSHLKSEPEANPSELLERAYSEILQFPEDIADAYKTEPKDYKALYEASQRALEATRAEVQMRDGEIAELRTALAEAMNTDTELHTEAEAIAAG